jgi:hypothetical protein
VTKDLLQPNPALIVAFMLCGLLANVAVWKTVAQVNSRLPEYQQFSYWWWTVGKYRRVWKEHKRLFPGSYWRVLFVLSLLMALVFMVLLVSTVHISNSM